MLLQVSVKVHDPDELCCVVSIIVCNVRLNLMLLILVVLPFYFDVNLDNKLALMITSSMGVDVRFGRQKPALIHLSNQPSQTSFIS